MTSSLWNACKKAVGGQRRIRQNRDFRFKSINMEKRIEGIGLKKLMMIGIVIVAIVAVAAVAAIAVISLDLFSYGATSSQTLNPSGFMGMAMVVYDPGVSGAAQQAATLIANDLVARNYTVVLAGVRSATVSNTSGYSIIIAGGPMYFGKVSSSIEGFLRTVPQSAVLGVFGTTGSGTFSASDFASLGQQVASASGNDMVALRLILQGNETSDCADLASTLVQLDD
ncbi:MAG: hypothetical protein LUP94_02200 [Candidatus Methanomethylicus sp.]|nr:hypothetical protein [Candidatus Methanomethylicus sp.]